MPRRILRKLTSKVDAIRDRWYFRPFGNRLADSRLWAGQRRSVTGAFAAGLAVCFVPLPVHTLLCLLIAVARRLNVPVIVATVWIVNPFTVVPIYYAAYRFGALLTGRHHVHAFVFEPSWTWLQYGLGPLWKPFLVGCAASALVCSVVGWLLLEWLWRRTVRYRYRHRPAARHRRPVRPGELPPRA